MRLAQISASTVAGLSLRLQAMVARINTVWAKEHTGDGKHLLPKWHPVVVSAGTFTSPSGWAVTAQSSYEFWKHGDCLSLSFLLFGTLAGADPYVGIHLPEGWVAASHAVNVVDLTLGAAYGTGLAFVQPQSSTVRIFKMDRTPFAAGVVNVFGQLQLRTTN